MHKIAWGFMVAVFFFAVTPHAFTLEFAAQKQTIDGIHTHPGVSKVHIHSEFLRISLSPTLPGHLVAVRSNFVPLYIHFEAPVIGPPGYFTFHYFLRGPPEMA
ncbi:MAG: hypothetical protein ACRDE2_10940 [Chitinophagaceae bacterium]